MELGSIAIFIPFVALSIPIIGVILSHRQKARNDKLKELELKKEILELEIKKQDSKILLLEAENRKLDKEINNI